MDTSEATKMTSATDEEVARYRQYAERHQVLHPHETLKLLARLEAVEEEVAELRKWDSRKMLRTRSL